MTTVDIDDLIDSSQVAEMLGLSHRNSVTTYQRRHPDFPTPRVVRGNGRVNLWLRQDIADWRDGNRLKERDGAGRTATPLAERHRAALVAAATELMAERSMSEISIREIATRAGLPHAMIYRHVGSKEALEKLVIDQTTAEVLHEVSQRLAAQGAEAGLDGLIETILTRRESILLLARALLAGEPAQAFDTPAVMASFLDALRAQVAADSGDSALAAVDHDLQVAVGSVAAMLLGWITFEARILAGTGLESVPIDGVTRSAKMVLRAAATPPPSRG